MNPPSTNSSSYTIGTRQHLNVRQTPPSKCHTYGFVIAIILMIGGLGLGAAGVAAYFQVGALSTLTQIEAIFMIAMGVLATGGGGGLLYLLRDRSASVKNTKAGSSITSSTPATPKNRSNSTQQPHGAPKLSAAQNLRVLGVKEWEKVGVTVLDPSLPPPPEFKDTTNSQMLVYIPTAIEYKGAKTPFNFEVLKKIFTEKNYHFICAEEIQKQMDFNVPGHWMIIDTEIKASSLKEAPKNARLPTLVEAVVVVLLTHAVTTRKLFAQEPHWTATLCSLDHSKDTPYVGGFDGHQLSIYYPNKKSKTTTDCLGTAFVKSN